MSRDRDWSFKPNAGERFKPPAPRLTKQLKRRKAKRIWNPPAIVPDGAREHMRSILSE